MSRYELSVLKETLARKAAFDEAKHKLEEAEAVLKKTFHGQFPKRIVIDGKLLVAAMNQGRLHIHTTKLDGVFKSDE